MARENYKTITVNFTLSNKADRELYQRLLQERGKSTLIKNLLEKYFASTK